MPLQSQRGSADHEEDERKKREEHQQLERERGVYLFFIFFAAAAAASFSLPSSVLLILRYASLAIETLCVCIYTFVKLLCEVATFTTVIIYFFFLSLMTTAGSSRQFIVTHAFRRGSDAGTKCGPLA